MLPEERQAAVIELLKKKSVAKARAQLMADGLTVSSGALSDFWSWWHLRQQYKQNESDVMTTLDHLRKSQPDLAEDKLFALGQRLFTILAIKSQNSKEWARTVKNADRRELVRIEKGKYQRQTCELFIKWVADEEAKKIASSTASNKDKIELLGRKMFGEDWE